MTARDFETLRDDNLASFSHRIEIIPQGGQLAVEVARLETEALQLFKMAVLVAKQEDDLDQVARFWTTMTEICDTYAARVQAVSHQHPQSQASFDKLLDLRNHCDSLRALHA